MKTFIITAALILASFVGVHAQEKYVGVQYVNTNPDITRSVSALTPKSDNFYGIVGSVTKYTNSVIGLTGEGSANFSGGRQPAQIYTLGAGVTLRCNNFKSVTPFVKGTVGAGFLHTNQTAFGPSNTDTALAFKASLGVNVGKGKVKYRPFEVGYLQTHFYGQRQDNLVLGTGITF